MKKSKTIIIIIGFFLIIGCSSNNSESNSTSTPITNTKKYKLSLFPSGEQDEDPNIYVLIADNVKTYNDLRTSTFPTLCGSEATDYANLEAVYNIAGGSRVISEWAQPTLGLELVFALDFAPDRTNYVGASNQFDSSSCQIPAGSRNFANSTIVDALKKEAEYIATYIKPDYFAFGVEVEAFIKAANDAGSSEQVTDMWNAFTEIKTAAMNAAIAAGNPEMKFFAYYLYENIIMHNLWSQIIPDKDLNDLYGFSSYPAASSTFNSTGSSFPADYYDAITTNFGTSKKILFLELGQPRVDVTGYDVGENGGIDQDDWMKAFFNSINNLDVELISYISTHDFDWPGTFFDKMGLRDYTTGEPFPAWDTFIGYGNGSAQ